MANMYRYGFFLFWGISTLLIVLRAGFDSKAYFGGATVQVHTIVPDDYAYLLHLPVGYTDFDEPRPLIVFLHGSGEINKGLTVLEKCDLWHWTKGQFDAEEFPFFVVSPMSPRYGWNPPDVARFIENIVQDTSRRYRIDPNRVYLSGFSMGAFGTFDTACERPELFAAIVPLAGAGEPENASSLKHVPTWALHGEKDEAISCEYSEKMISAMKNVDCDEARLTIIPGAGHGIVEDVYRNPELYRWMLKHQKQK